VSLRPYGLRRKLALLFFAITAAAFAPIFAYVIPQLESNLEERELRDLRRTVGASSGALEEVMGRDIGAGDLDELVRRVADGAEAQVTLLGVQRSFSGGAPEQPSFYVISDSRSQSEVVLDFGLARRAVRKRAIQLGVDRLGGDDLALGAQPLYYRGSPQWVAVYSRSVEDVADAVALIRSRLLLAGALAVLVALGGGYLVARALALRAARLERAARRVAAGQFVDPLPVSSDDELGQLARAFNDMQAQLGRVDRARKDFVANASHELRTPVFSIGGFVELLQDEDLDEATRRDFLASMHEQVERLQRLAADLLDLSRLDSGSVQLEREAVDLTEVMENVAAEFRPAVSRHEARLDVRSPGGPAEANADRAAVARIVRILLDNALRHTPPGSHVTLIAQRHETATLTVTDNGPGMRAEDAAIAFDRFHTGDTGRGSGLGLAIAKELAEQMRGRLSLNSQPGRTDFTLELPGLPASGAT